MVTKPLKIRCVHSYKKEMKKLIQFIEKSKAFDISAKFKLILFIAGVKPSTYIHLRIGKNLHDKHKFEDLLKKNKIIFNVGRAKGYEEIQKITNSAIWQLNGIWYGYDFFQTKEDKKRFDKYIELLKKHKQTEADRLSGTLYGYPTKCVEAFIKERNKKNIAKYSYYQYYKRLHDMDKAFPFIIHRPCSPKCTPSKKLNEFYKRAVKKHAPKFYKEYTKKRTYHCPIIVDIENDIKGIWKKKTGRDYTVVTKNKIENKYWLLSWLSKKAYERGTILDATITMQYDYAVIKTKKVIGKIENFHHKRHFAKP